MREGDRINLKGFPLPHFATFSATSSHIPGQLLASATRDLALPNNYERTQLKSLKVKVIKTQETDQSSHYPSEE